LSLSSDHAWERIKTLAEFPDHLELYYKEILEQYTQAYAIAAKARLEGLDPKDSVEPKTAFDLADRVNQMLGLDQFEGLAERLRELLRTTSKERAALTISQEIALGKFGVMEIKRALEYSVRAGLAVITDGLTVAPIQGIYSVTVKQNEDNTSYASVSYAGPMRSAGGTEAAFSLVIADVIAKKLGLSNYRAREEEIGRFIEELRVYEREVGNFQFKVSDEDIRNAISNLSIEIDGVETDPVEVVVHRNLARVGTDRVRGGALRVLNDGVIGRARKLAKILQELNIADWDWLNELRGVSQQSAYETEQTDAHFEEVISGRAVLSSPRRPGGFRLRYGRSVNTGLSTVGIHPAVAVLLDFPVVVGTQVKVDLPGKAATIAFVDSIEGPTILLKDGSVRKVSRIEEAIELHYKLDKIIDLGDVLISFGDFLENNKSLPASPYVIEWWSQDFRIALSGAESRDKLERRGISKERVDAILQEPFSKPPTFNEAMIFSEELDLPLYPAFTFRFDRFTVNDLLELRRGMKRVEDKIVVDVATNRTELLIRQLLAPFRREGSCAIFEGETASVLIKLLHLESDFAPSSSTKTSLELIKELSGIGISKQTTATVGMRVGRPEKAMLRKLKPPVHVLFPVETRGGPMRDLIAAAKQDIVTVDIVNIKCDSCGSRRLSASCPECNLPTRRFVTCLRCESEISEMQCPRCKLKGVTHSTSDVNINELLNSAFREIDKARPHSIKGVRGLTSQSKMPEAIKKGILRSKHNLFVYKDGTIRIDVTNAPLTHFRPHDLQNDLTTLFRLGYSTDYLGAPLISDSQIVELKPQDIIIPFEIGQDLVRTAKFVDDELRYIYRLQPFYNVDAKEDLLGKTVIGLAPHTSVGVLGRIIGYTNAQVCFANPLWHAAKRRDCDGDGDSLLLVLDALLNFSVEYLPDQIGGLMDTPLLIQPIILPSEVDQQAHNFDIAMQYPSSFYEETQKIPNATLLARSIETIGTRLGTAQQFYAFGFTNPTSQITTTRTRSTYSTLKTLPEKISKQLDVAEKIEAVSTKEVVESIIRTHLIRDIVGNMRKYCGQSFKCKGCGQKFRRTTVSGRCTRCGMELRETLSRASIEKYLTLAQKLANQYDVDRYVKSRLDLAVRELAQLFTETEEPSQLTLTDFVTA
jgi:DNA polymerase II large subunit